MTLARVAILVAKGAALALTAFGFFVVSLRYVHHLPLPTSRTVEIAGGRLALEVPRPWIVGYSTTPPHGLAIEHRALPVWATISLRQDPNAAGMDPVSILRARGLAASAQGPGRAVASVAHDADGLAASHHLAVVDRRGRLMHLQVDVGHAPGAEWLPSVRADAHFMQGAVQRSQLRGDPELARKEYDQWAPAREALRAIDADVELSFDALLWAALAFAVTWAAAHLVFERRMRLGKVGYTWVGQATTVVSFVGLLLAAASLFTGRMEHRAKLAESATFQVASAAAFYMNEQAALCPRDWVASIPIEPLVSGAKQVSMPCEKFKAVMARLAQHFVYAGTQTVRQGDFVDPNWVLGLPISMFVGKGDRIIGQAGLDDEQHEALSNRYMFFMEPLEQALRIVQKQSDMLATAQAFRNVSGLWSVCLAASLALGMVKLSGDRRIEREKEAEKEDEKAAVEAAEKRAEKNVHKPQQAATGAAEVQPPASAPVQVPAVETPAADDVPTAAADPAPAAPHPASATSDPAGTDRAEPR